MSAAAGVFSSVRWEASGGGTPVTVAKNLVTFPSLTKSPETLLLATGIDQRLRSSEDVVVIVQDISAFAALKTLMLARTELDFDIIGASTHNWDPVRFTVKYVLDQVPNSSEIFIGADAAVGDPTTDAGNWTSLGSIEGGNAPAITVNGKGDGVDKTLYVTTSVAWKFRLIDDAATAVQTTLASFQNTVCRIAIKSPDGTYLILGGASAGQGVTCQWEAAPKFGIAEFSSAVDMDISGVDEDPDDLIVIPGSAPDYVYAFELLMNAKSTSHSDFYSIT